MYGTGVSESDGFGRHKKRSLRKEVQTQVGDIREDLWYQLAEQVIGLHGEARLLEVLEVWMPESELICRLSIKTSFLQFLQLIHISCRVYVVLPFKIGTFFHKTAHI